MTDSQTAIALAFPHIKEGESHNIYHPGLTKREYFAALTMQAMTHAWADMVTDGIPYGSVAFEAVKLADALIAELAK